MAAFVWMLCEGLYLFIFINFVFYSGFFIKRNFYLGLGWGKFIYSQIHTYVYTEMDPEKTINIMMDL